MSGIIYIITTGDEGYVGSTNNFRKRFNSHSCTIYNKNSKDYNAKLYKTIRENNGEWDMCIYEDNLSLNKKELCIREEKVRVLLGATLNCRRAFQTEEQKQEYKFKSNLDWKSNNKEHIRQYKKKYNNIDIDCKCGEVVKKCGFARHKRSAKHIKRMISLEQNDQA